MVVRAPASASVARRRPSSAFISRPTPAAAATAATAIPEDAWKQVELLMFKPEWALFQLFQYHPVQFLARFYHSQPIQSKHIPDVSKYYQAYFIPGRLGPPSPEEASATGYVPNHPDIARWMEKDTTIPIRAEEVQELLWSELGRRLSYRHKGGAD
jgi:hypothetical protein